MYIHKQYTNTKMIRSDNQVRNSILVEFPQRSRPHHERLDSVQAFSETMNGITFIVYMSSTDNDHYVTCIDVNQDTGKIVHRPKTRLLITDDRVTLGLQRKGSTVTTVYYLSTYSCDTDHIPRRVRDTTYDSSGHWCDMCHQH